MKRKETRNKTLRRPPPASKVEPSGENFFYHVTDASDAPDREFEDIILRRVPRSVAHRFRGGAGARALTHAQYLAALLNLHESARQAADRGDGDMSAVLKRLGLQTVSV